MENSILFDDATVFNLKKLPSVKKTFKINITDTRRNCKKLLQGIKKDVIFTADFYRRAYHRVRKVGFSENFSYVIDGWCLMNVMKFSFPTHLFIFIK